MARLGARMKALERGMAVLCCGVAAVDQRVERYRREHEQILADPVAALRNAPGTRIACNHSGDLATDEQLRQHPKDVARILEIRRWGWWWLDVIRTQDDIEEAKVICAEILAEQAEEDRRRQYRCGRQWVPEYGAAESLNYNEWRARYPQRDPNALTDTEWESLAAPIGAPLPPAEVG